MSTSVSGLSTNFFPSAQNGFSTTLASTISSAATTVPLNSVAGYNNGEIAVFVVDPTDVTKKQTFTGIIDTSGVQVTSVVWTAGTNQTHSGGSTVVDYATATHISMITKGLLKQHTQAGAHTGITTDTITVSSGTTLPAGDIGTADLAAGAVTFPKLAAGATRLGLNNNAGSTSGGLTTSYVTFATVTATSTGGVCEAAFNIQAANANSGSFVTMSVQVLCDGVATTPASLDYNLPFITGASPNYSYSFIMSSTPAAGSHTWALQVKASGNTQATLFNNQLKISEVK